MSCLTNADLTLFLSQRVFRPEHTLRVHSMFFDELRAQIDQAMTQLIHRLCVLKSVMNISPLGSTHVLTVLDEVPLTISVVMDRERFAELIKSDIQLTERAREVVQQAIERKLQLTAASAMLNMFTARRKTLETRDITLSMAFTSSGMRPLIRNFLQLEMDFLLVDDHAAIQRVNHLLTFAASTLIHTTIQLRSMVSNSKTCNLISRAVELVFPTADLSREALSFAPPEGKLWSAKHFRKLDLIDKLDEPSVSTLIGVLEWIARYAADNEDVLRCFGVY
jgi:histone H3/H4